MSHIDAIAHILRCYPGWACPTDTARTWALEVSVLPADAVYAAAKALCLESEYPPTLAGLFRRASILARPATPGTTPGEAWSELMRNRIVASKNRYESRDEKRLPYTWTSEAARSAAESVNWKGEWEGEQMGTIRAQFERYFKEITARQAEIDWASNARSHVDQVAQLEHRACNVLERK